MGSAVGNHRSVWKTFRFKVGTGEHDVTGTAGVKTLYSDGKIPDNAQILRAVLEPITTGASLGLATVKLGITGNDDCFIGATAMDHASFVPEEPVALTAEVPLKVATSGGVDVIGTVATATITAMEFDVHVEYLPGR